jgi:surface protein
MKAKTFKFTVVTTSSPQTFTLPLEASGTYNFRVDWGDGNIDVITAYDNAAVTHSYASAGTYTIKIIGVIRGWRFNNAGDKTLIHDISSWGPLLLGNNNGYFYGCSNLTVSATDILDISSVTTFYHAFASCSSLTTLDVSAWNTASVTTFQCAFQGCISLTTLDVSAWNTASVTTFRYAFRSCSSLTTLDVSAWNTASVTTFHYAFCDCSSLTTLAANNWDITAVTEMADMFLNVTLSTINYSNIIIAWEGQAVNNNIVFHGGNSKYSAGAAATARQALIDDHTWTITDGGQEP